MEWKLPRVSVCALATTWVEFSAMAVQNRLNKSADVNAGRCYCNKWSHLQDAASLYIATAGCLEHTSDVAGCCWVVVVGGAVRVVTWTFITLTSVQLRSIERVNKDKRIQVQSSTTSSCVLRDHGGVFKLN